MACKFHFQWVVLDVFHFGLNRNRAGEVYLLVFIFMTKISRRRRTINQEDTTKERRRIAGVGKTFLV